MSFKAIWADRSPYRKFLILLGLVLISTFFSITLSYLLIKPLFGLEIMSNPALINDFSNPIVMDAIKLMQIFQTFGFFIIPPFLMIYFSYREDFSYLSIHKAPRGTDIILVILLIFLAVPVINWLGYWNDKMVLPSFMSEIEQWMRNSEKQLAELSKEMLKTESAGGLFVNIIVMALLPAVGEELLFRGLIQRMFGEWTKNINVAIILTAFIFSAMHRQFYGFVPRMVLGVILGYLLVWSGSLWLPIIAHFANNAAAVISYYVIHNSHLEIPIDSLGYRGGDEWALITGFIGLIIVTSILYKKRIKVAPV